MQISSITIEEAVEQFKIWRQNKNTKFEPIPTHLKDLAKQLLNAYPISQLATTLQISRSALYNIQKGKHCSSVGNNQPPETESLNFIPVNLTGLNQTTKNQSISHASAINLTCQIIKPNGTKLIIHTNDTNAIIQAFLCYN